MKRISAALLLIIMVLSIGIGSVSYASPATSYTWALNAKGRWTRTQDAYLPELTLIDLDLKEPEDLFVDGDNNLYIADTGNKRIVKYDIDHNQVVQIIEADVFKTPRGVYVTEDGNIYVADAKAEAIHHLDSQGNLIESFGRPEEVAFGNTPFNPAKIAVDSKKNMFVIGEGVLNGIIHISSNGQFLGYFASNKVTLDLIDELQNFFFTEEQMDNTASRVPLTMTNVFVDQENVVYSTTMGTEAVDIIAKHNTAGRNVFADPWGPYDLIDVYVDQEGIIYAAGLAGSIFVYSPEGDYIHSFGAFFSDLDITGMFTELGSVAVDHQGRIWAADKSTSYVQSFRKTDYADTIYKALTAFNQGQYDQAETLWLEVLSWNQMLRLAHEGIGKVYLYTERYDEAMTHLKIADNKYFYSQAYWEVRNIWLQNNLTWLLTGALVLWFAVWLLKRLDRKYRIYDPFRRLKKKIRSYRVMDDLLFIFDFIKHPLDSYYDLKIGKRGSMISASLIYLIFFAVYIHSSFGRGFLFTPVPIEDIDFGAMTLGFVTISMLFILTNYLVSSIQDGDGTIGDIYKLTAYAMGPMILSIVAVTGLSFILTYNEEFFIELIEVAAPTWSLILLVLGLQEVHQYTTRESIKSILISLAFMLVIAIMLLIVIIMGEQVYDFFEVIVREVIRNVTN